MLIAVDDKDRLFRGIFGQTPTVSPTPTPTPTPTPAGGYIQPLGLWQLVRSPAVYAKHALEYAFKQFQSALGYRQPWIRTGQKKAISPELYNQILDFALAWARTYPKQYKGIIDGKGYYVSESDSAVVGMTPRPYLENYLTNYYLFVPETATVIPTRREVVTVTPTATVVIPTITANVQKIVRDNLEFNSIPPIAGSVRGDIYDAVVSKSIIDILMTEYPARVKSPPPGLTYDDLKARNRDAVLSYMNSLGLKRGSTRQSPQFISSVKGTSPLKPSQERQWWGSSTRERAEWAVKAVMKDLGIRYSTRGTTVTPEQPDQIIAGALRWLQAVASDPVFVMDKDDRELMQIAMNLVNLNLLQKMRIAVIIAPDWRERVRYAVTFWLGRTPDKTMTSAEYTEYLRTVGNTAIHYWKKDRDSFITRGGTPARVTDTAIRQYVDTLLREAITIEVAAPTPTLIPTRTPTATPTPTPTPAIMTLAEAAARGFSEAIRDGNYQNIATGKKYGATVFFYLAADLYDRMMAEAVTASKRVYLEAGGDPSTLSDEDWLRNLRLINNTALDRRFVREVAAVTPTPVIPVTPAITPRVTPVENGEAALREWAATAPIFETYQQCRAAAEEQVGRVPDQWRDCLCESDMIDQAVSHALIQRGIRPYPGSLEVTEAAFDSVMALSLGITQQMVYQRTYTPVIGGQVLQLAQ